MNDFDCKVRFGVDVGFVGADLESVQIVVIEVFVKRHARVDAESGAERGKFIQSLISVIVVWV